MVPIQVECIETSINAFLRFVPISLLAGYSMFALLRHSLTVRMPYRINPGPPQEVGTSPVGVEEKGPERIFQEDTNDQRSSRRKGEESPPDASR